MLRLLRAVGHLALVTALLGVGLYVAAVLVIMADVLARPFQTAVPGVVDIVQLCVLAGTYLILPYTFLTRGHVAVDLFVGRLPARLRGALDAAALLLALALLLPMLRWSYGTAVQQIGFGDRSQTIGIPIVWYWAPLLVGLALSAVSAACLLVARVVGRADEIGRQGP